jgi:transcriptional regulator with XRE-family HTH domain
VCEEADPNDLISWEEVFPEYEESELPGITLAGARYKEGMTQRELSRRTGIPQGHISEMENGKRSIGVRIAKKIGQALDIDFRVFL